MPRWEFCISALHKYAGFYLLALFENQTTFEEKEKIHSVVSCFLIFLFRMNASVCACIYLQFMLRKDLFPDRKMIEYEAEIAGFPISHNDYFLATGDKNLQRNVEHRCEKFDEIRRFRSATKTSRQSKNITILIPTVLRALADK